MCASGRWCEHTGYGMDSRYRLQANVESTWGIEVYFQGAIT
jgi:hypothetical protein